MATTSQERENTMPRFRLNFTYEYDANPEDYFDEVPSELTPGLLQKMVNIDSDSNNIRDFIHYIVSTGEYEGTIEVV